MRDVTRLGILMLVVGVLQAVLLASTARAEPSSFLEMFDSLEPSRWSVGDHNLGRSYLDPNNVSVRGGDLTLEFPANELNGGEIASNDTYSYGSYAARIKVPNAPSSITGFFLYEPPDHASEIDIEIYNDTSRKVVFTTFSGGK